MNASEKRYAIDRIRRLAEHRVNAKRKPWWVSKFSTPEQVTAALRRINGVEEDMGKPVTNRDVQIREEWRSIWEAGKSRIPQDLMPALELVGQRLGIKPATVRISLLKLREDPYPVGRPKTFRRRKRKVIAVPTESVVQLALAKLQPSTPTNSIKHQLARLTRTYTDLATNEKEHDSLEAQLKLVLETLKGLI